jgi:hypothetical protein
VIRHFPRLALVLLISLDGSLGSELDQCDGDVLASPLLRASRFRTRIGGSMLHSSDARSCTSLIFSDDMHVLSPASQRCLSRGQPSPDIYLSSPLDIKGGWCVVAVMFMVVVFEPAMVWSLYYSCCSYRVVVILHLILSCIKICYGFDVLS